MKGHISGKILFLLILLASCSQPSGSSEPIEPANDLTQFDALISKTDCSFDQFRTRFIEINRYNPYPVMDEVKELSIVLNGDYSSEWHLEHANRNNYINFETADIDWPNVKARIINDLFIIERDNGKVETYSISFWEDTYRSVMKGVVGSFALNNSPYFVEGMSPIYTDDYSDRGVTYQIGDKYSYYGIKMENTSIVIHNGSVNATTYVFNIECKVIKGFVYSCVGTCEWSHTDGTSGVRNYDISTSIKFY